MSGLFSAWLGQLHKWSSDNINWFIFCAIIKLATQSHLTSYKSGPCVHTLEQGQCLPKVKIPVLLAWHLEHKVSALVKCGLFNNSNSNSCLRTELSSRSGNCKLQIAKLLDIYFFFFNVVEIYYNNARKVVQLVDGLVKAVEVSLVYIQFLWNLN